MKKRRTLRGNHRSKGTPSTKKTTPTKKGVVFHAVPNERNIMVKLSPEGKPQMVFPGRVIYTEKIRKLLSENCSVFWFPGGSSQGGPGRCDWIINNLADSDLYSDALKHLSEGLQERNLPIFNHPARVLETGRDVVWKKLADVPNLIAPKCVRFLATHPNEFRLQFEWGSFEYPVLIRPAGTHTGKDLVLISSEDDWDKIYEISWGGKEVYIAQWVDFMSANGEWRKLRLSITPESIRLRHILYGNSWLVHAMERNALEAERELDILQNFDSWAALQNLGSDIRQRIGLDFFGVDLGWKSDSEFVLFEANASMSILSYDHMPEHRRQDYISNLHLIEEDVLKALSKFSGSS